MATLVFSKDEVYLALTQLDPNKVTGIDKIGPKILKYCAWSLFRPLRHLFNSSLSTGVIPLEWRVHLITPVYKSSHRSSVQNYRPTSLLCNTSKVLKTLIYNRLFSYISDNITLCQFGFLQCRPTTQQLILYLAHIYHGTSRGYQTDSIYLDFRKAFDSGLHNKLLYKLRLYGISGKLGVDLTATYIIGFNASEFVILYLTNCQFCPVCPRGVFLAHCCS